MFDIVRGSRGLRWVGRERDCTRRECCFYPFGQWVEERAAAAVGIAAAGIVAVAAGIAVVAEAGIVVAVAAVAAGTGWDSHQRFGESAP